MPKQQTAPNKATSTNYIWIAFSVFAGVAAAYLIFGSLPVAIAFGLPIGLIFALAFQNNSKKLRKTQKINSQTRKSKQRQTLQSQKPTTADKSRTSTAPQS